VDRLGEDFPLGSKGGVAAEHYFPVDAEYVIKLKLQRTWSSEIRGLNQPNQFEIFVDGKRVGHLVLGGEKGMPRTFLYDGDEALQVRVPVKAGLHRVMATMLKTADDEPEGVGPDHLPLFTRASDNPTSTIAIAALLIGGPYNAKASADSPSRELVFVCYPASAAEEMQCATKILSRMARRAYRRA